MRKAEDGAKAALDEKLAGIEEERQEYDKLQSWADLYDNCTFAARKMIGSQFVKAVRVYRDYTLEIDFNVSFEEFKRFASQDSTDEVITA